MQYLHPPSNSRTSWRFLQFCPQWEGCSWGPGRPVCGECWPCTSTSRMISIWKKKSLTSSIKSSNLVLFLVAYPAIGRFFLFWTIHIRIGGCVGDARSKYQIMSIKCYNLSYQVTHYWHLVYLISDTEVYFFLTLSSPLPPPTPHHTHWVTCTDSSLPYTHLCGNLMKT